jgi:hypothetical protein
VPQISRAKLADRGLAPLLQIPLGGTVDTTE